MKLRSLEQFNMDRKRVRNPNTCQNSVYDKVQISRQRNYTINGVGTTTKTNTQVNCIPILCLTLK